MVSTHLDISIDPEKDEKVVALGFSLAHVGHKQHAASAGRGAPRKPKAGLKIKNYISPRITCVFAKIQNVSKIILPASERGFPRGLGSLQSQPVLLQLVDPLKSTKFINDSSWE